MNISKQLRKKLKEQYSNGLRREGLVISNKKRYELLDEIISKIGLPNKCFFDSEFCFSPQKYDQEYPMEFGHIKPISKGGTLSDTDNVIWICRRHNIMMGDRDLKELKVFLLSLRKNL